MKALIPVICVSLLLQACVTSPVKRRDITRISSDRRCGEILDSADWDREESLLGTTQDLLEARCHPESLELGRLLRDRLRDKDYSVTAEALSVLGPEQMSQTYVLESHERTYLTLVLAINHIEMGKHEAAKVELRRATQELDAVLYNHGRDDASHILMAGLWEEVGEPDLAAPYWRRLGLEQFASARDLANPWRIYAVGNLEGYDWRMGEGAGGGIYRITPKTEIPKKCVSATGALIPIDDWVRKMELRHAHDYHPLLNFKSYVRFPIGLSYGVLLGGTGLAVAVGGCAAVSQGGGSGNGCRAAFELGGALMAEAPNAFNYAAQPDLRHWSKSPVAFLITRSPAPEAESCATSLRQSPILRR